MCSDKAGLWISTPVHTHNFNQSCRVFVARTRNASEWQSSHKYYSADLKLGSHLF